MKLGEAAFISLVVYIFCLGARNGVHGVPMYPGYPESSLPHSPSRISTFGEVEPHDLINPFALPVHQDSHFDSWNAPLHQEFHHQDQSGNYPVSNWNQDPFIPHFANHPMQSWNQDYTASHHYDNNVEEAQQSYNPDQLDNAFTKVHLESHPSVDPYSNIYAQGSHQGQSSNSDLLASSSPLHHQVAFIPFAQRGELSPEELKNRPGRLNEFPWQKRYHENELIYLYNTIAEIWGTLPKSTMTTLAFPRLNKRLQDNPKEIDGIFGDDANSISNTAKWGGRRYSRNVPILKKPRYMNASQFIQWILAPTVLKDDPSTTTSHKTILALASLSSNDASLILNRLAKSWNMEKEEVEECLSVLTKSEFELFHHILVGENENAAWHAAFSLHDFVVGKVMQQQNLN